MILTLEGAIGVLLRPLLFMLYFFLALFQEIHIAGFLAVGVEKDMQTILPHCLSMSLYRKKL